VVPAINPVHYGLETLHFRPEIISDLLAALDRNHYGLAVPALTSFTPAHRGSPPPDTLIHNRAVFPLLQSPEHFTSVLQRLMVLPYTKTITCLNSLTDALIYIGLVYAPT
jgi:hypothetical protein